MTPQPQTDGVVLDQYLEEFQKDILQPSSVLVRTLGANHEPLLAKIADVFSLSVISGGEHAHDMRNDKLFDIGSGLVLLAQNPHVPLIAGPRFKFLTPGLIGDLACGYTLLVAKSGVAAVAAVAGRAGAAFAKTSSGRQLLERASSVAMVQRCQDLALQSVVNGGTLRTPMEIEVLMRPHEAVRFTNGRFTRRQVLRAKRDGFVRVRVLTDNVELQLHGSVRDLLAAGAGKADMPDNTPRLLQARIPHTKGTVFIDEKALMALRQTSATAWGRAAEGAMEAGRGAHAVVDSVQGRLALGVILINGVGLSGALGALGSDDAKKVRDAWVGTLDSTASVMAGALQVTEAAAKASIERRLGVQGVERSVGLPFLRFFAASLGAFAGVVNMVGQFMRAGDATGMSRSLYYGSGVAFLGTAITSGLAAAGAFADMQVAKGTASAVMRRLAMRYGAHGAATLMGVSVSGWGLICLGLALAFEVGIVMITPTEMQKWLSRTRFGRNGDEPRFTSWEQEVDGLSEALGNKPKAAPVAVPPPAAAAGAPA